MIAVIIAVSLLLCGGAVTAGVLIVQHVTNRAKEAVEPIINVTPPAVPTEVPDLPTDLPDLPTDLPDLPTGLPDIPGLGGKITVVYEVSGDGPAEIVYAEKLGDGPKRLSDTKLPWKITVPMEGPSIVSVSAARLSSGSGEIRCRATVDGEEVVQSSRSGAFAAVTCNKVVVG